MTKKLQKLRQMTIATAPTLGALVAANTLNVQAEEVTNAPEASVTPAAAPVVTPPVAEAANTDSNPHPGSEKPAASTPEQPLTNSSNSGYQGNNDEVVTPRAPKADPVVDSNPDTEVEKSSKPVEQPVVTDGKEDVSTSVANTKPTEKTDKQGEKTDKQGEKTEVPVVNPTPDKIDENQHVKPSVPAQGDEGITPSREGTDKDTSVEEAERQGKSSMGHVDAYVSHAELDTAIRKAVAAGVHIHRTETVVYKGDAKETAKRVEEARKYYQVKEKEITKAMDDYKVAVYNHQVDRAETESEINAFNTETTILMARLEKNKRPIRMGTKEYSKEVAQADRKALLKALEEDLGPEGNVTPVNVYTYTLPKRLVENVTPPSLEFHYWDIRSTPSVDTEIENKDGDKINGTDSNGKEVIKAVKNQTVVSKTTNEELPKGRFDKIHSIISYLKLPKGVEFDASVSKSNDDWTFTYNKASREVTVSATPRYLVKVNQRQDVNDGKLGGYMETPFKYDIPGVALKVVDENKQYAIQAQTLINDEYLATAKTIVIETRQADPKKHNLDEQFHIIDGTATLPGSVNYYDLTWDFDQYKGINIDKNMQTKGLSLYDFFPHEVVSFDGGIKIMSEGREIAVGQADGTFKDVKSGKTVQGVNWSIVDAVDGIKRKGPAVKVGISGVDHPWYKQYVQQGKSLNVRLLMTTKKIDNTPDEEGGSYGGQTYGNKFYQNDFGNLYESNTTQNKVVKTNPLKDAVDSLSNLSSLNLKYNPEATIEHNGLFQYRASGSGLPKGVRLKSYEIVDQFHEADQYDGVYFVESNQPLYFKKGSNLAKRYPNGMAANTDITRYTNQVISRNVSKDINTKPGAVSGADGVITTTRISLDADFIEQIDFAKSNFQLDVFMQAKRKTKVNGVTNSYEEVINGISFGSNLVKTNTRTNRVDSLNNLVDQLGNKVDENKKNSDQKVEDTKKALDQKLEDAKKNLDKKVDDAKSNLDKKIEDAKKQLDQKINDAKSNTDSDTRDKLEETRKELSKRIDKIKEDLNAKIDKNHKELNNTINQNQNEIKKGQKDLADKVDQEIKKAKKEQEDAQKQLEKEINKKIDDIKSDLDKKHKDLKRGQDAIKDDLKDLINQDKNNQAKKIKVGKVTIKSPKVKTKEDAINYVIKALNLSPKNIKKVEKVGDNYVVHYEVNAKHKPSEKPEDKKPSEKPGDKKPSEKPSEKPGDKKPSEKPEDKKPGDKKPSKPSEKPGDKKPSKPSEKPSDKPEDKKPADKPSEKPEDKKPAGKPSEKPEDKKPADKPSEKPEDKKPADKPSEKPEDQKPADKPSEKPEDKKPSESEDKKVTKQQTQGVRRGGGGGNYRYTAPVKVTKSASKTSQKNKDVKKEDEAKLDKSIVLKIELFGMDSEEEVKALLVRAGYTEDQFEIQIERQGDVFVVTVIKRDAKPEQEPLPDTGAAQDRLDIPQAPPSNQRVLGDNASDRSIQHPNNPTSTNPLITREQLESLDTKSK